MFDPRVKEIIDASKFNLEKLHKERDINMKQFEQEQQQIKLEKVAQVEKMFTLKMAIAKKSDDPEKLKAIEQQKLAAMDKAELEFNERKEEEASKIKQSYD